MKELVQLVLENTVTGRIDRKVATEILGLLKKRQNNSGENAIIGISLRFPLANNMKVFWENLTNGTDCIHELSSERKVDSKEIAYVLDFKNKNEQFVEGGFLEEVDKFDYSLFRISPREANLMDPHQRLFLETAWSAIEDAGYGGGKLNGSKTGIYLGYNSWPIYGFTLSYSDLDLTSNSTLDNDPALIPSRIAYLLNLRGPSMLVNTACSSSLVAIHLACQALRNDECDLALAGGVKINLSPLKSLLNMGMESADCRTKTFDDQSDGTGFGEGVAAILIKPLDKAIMDRDRIYAVIKGSALNQDGTSIGITAPNVEAQEEVIQAAWRDAGIEPETISYIEAHGTGTQFGDMIEIEGIKRAFRRYTNRKQFCAIGTVKTNIGHLDSASGMASLIKAVLALQNKQLPPSLHFKRPNRKISFEDSPVFVNDRLRTWEKGETSRRCGLSAFGFSGCNCHIVLEEAPETEPVEVPETSIIKPRVLTLSAVTESALKELIGVYQTYLTEEPAIDIDDLCYTANTGRGHYGYRLLISCQDYDDLKAKIDKLSQSDLNGLNGPEIFYGKYQMISNRKLMKETGEITREEKRSLDINTARILDGIAKQKEPDKEELERKILELGKLYIQGADFQWDRIYQNAARRKINIPGYPFQRERCWFEFHNLNMDQIQEKTIKAQPIVKSAFKVELKGREHFSEIEQRLAGIWAEVLGFKEIAVTEDFYQLGGDSITMMLITSRIHQEFDVELTLRQIFDASTIEAIGEMIEKAPKSLYASIEAVPVKEYYPVSSAQKRLFIIDQFEGDKTNYNIPGVFEVTGIIERERFEKTIKQLIERHESFRTSFELIEGEPVQRIQPHVDFCLNYQELDQKDVDSEESINGIIQEFIQPFYLNQAPLVRAGLFKISEDRHLLMFDMHHIIADGASINILIRDFVALYNGESIADLRIQYKDFSEWQNNFFQNDGIKKQEEYWLNRFNGEIPVLNLPTDNPRLDLQNYEGATIQFELNQQLIEDLNRIAIENNTTLFTVLLSGYFILLYKYTGQEDIIIGITELGRHHSDLENIIGMFVNTLAIRNQPIGNKTIGEFLIEVKKNVFDAFENQEYQFEKLVSQLKIVRDRNRNPLFDVCFNMIAMDLENNYSLGDLKIKPFEFKLKATKFDMIFNIFQHKSGINIQIEYQAGLFKHETIENLAEHYLDVLRYLNQMNSQLKQIEIINPGIHKKVSLKDEGEFNF